MQLKQSKEGEDGQLVKCKDTGVYLLLYIPIDHKELERHFSGNNKMLLKKHWGNL